MPLKLPTACASKGNNMETALVLYAISILPNFAAFIAFLGIFGLIVGGIGCGIELANKPLDGDAELMEQSKGESRYDLSYDTRLAYDRNELHIPAKAIRKLTLVPGICLIFVASLIPTERSMWLIAGGYIAQEAVTTELGQDVVEIIKHKVSEYKKEITGEQHD